MRERSAFRLLVVLLGVLALLGFAACGDDDDDTTAATTTTEADDTGGEPDDPAAAEEEIRTNISALFSALGEAGAAVTAQEDPSEPQAEVVSYIENGEANADSVLTVAPLAAAGLEVVIDSVTFTGEASADFQYDLLLGGQPTQVQDSTGEAVLEDGTWKLAEEIWQTLVALAEQASGGGGGDGGESTG